MFENVRAYEKAMQSSGIDKYDRMQDAADMFSDAKAYERDARAFVDECVSKRHAKNTYAIEMDFNHFHERRLRELQQKWRRSTYLVECATMMAESVRDTNLRRLKSRLADPHDAGVINDVHEATHYVAPEERGLYNLIERATVSVTVRFKDKTASTGTGFFVAPGVVLTNSHVVQDKDAEVTVSSKALGGGVSARVIAFSNNAARDYALLRVDRIASLCPTPLKFSTDIKHADKVIAWGFPGVVIKNDPRFAAMVRGDMRSAPDVVYSEGVIRSIQDQDPPFVLHTAVVSYGNSGGPLVNTKGQVLGIQVAIFYRDDQNESPESRLVNSIVFAQNTELAKSLLASDIMKFMREHGIYPNEVF